MADSELYEAINDLVVGHLTKAMTNGEMINLPDWVSELMESTADLILSGAPEAERARLIEHAHQELNRFIREKRDIADAQTRKLS